MFFIISLFAFLSFVKLSSFFIPDDFGTILLLRALNIVMVEPNEVAFVIGDLFVESLNFLMLSPP